MGNIYEACGDHLYERSRGWGSLSLGLQQELRQKDHPLLEHQIGEGWEE